MNSRKIRIIEESFTCHPIKRVALLLSKKNKYNRRMITLTQHILLPHMSTVQHILLQDHTSYDPHNTDEHAILWATNSYPGHAPSDEMTEHAYSEITPRYIKVQEIQDKRRKTRGEVFTPTWLCNHMNNYADKNYFNSSNLFNSEDMGSHTWTETREYEKHSLTERDTYIRLRQLEIACGEAPFLVSPYDSNTGALIPLTHRIGLLDRKLQWINSTTHSYDEWLELVLTAYHATYGFEYQGDNLLIARLNLLNTYCDYHVAQWDKMPSIGSMETISTIISWNLWQMDGLPNPATLKKHKKQSTEDTITPRPQHDTHCMIRLWKHTNPQEDTIPFIECETTDDALF